MTKTKALFMFSLALGLSFVLQATAGTVLYNFGLPTANLNNAAGSDQANVSWSDTESSSSPSAYLVPGGSFTLPGTETYHVSDIRVWEVGAGTTAPGYLPSGESLLGGLSGSSMGTLSSTYSSSSVTYANGSLNQDQYGNFWNIYQLDFSVNLTLSGGQAFDFFLDGPFTLGDSSGDYFNPFLHASNAGLSNGGSTASTSDTMLWLDVTGSSQTVETWYTGTGGGTSGMAAGWNKNSQANVEVFGQSVPDTANTLFLLALGIIGLGVLRFGQKRLQMEN